MFYLSLSLAVLGYLTGAGSLLTDAGMDPITVKHALSIIALLLGVGNTVLAALQNPQARNMMGLGPR